MWIEPMVYLNCQHCVEDGSRGAYDIAVSPTGDLHLICRDHHPVHGAGFLVIENKDIAEKLREIGRTKCEHCGGDCGHKENVH